MSSTHSQVMLHAGAKKTASALAGSGLKGACKRIPANGLDQSIRPHVLFMVVDGIHSYGSLAGYVAAGSTATRAPQRFPHDRRDGSPFAGRRALPQLAASAIHPARAPLLSVRRALSVCVPERVSRLPGREFREHPIPLATPFKRPAKKTRSGLFGNATPELSSGSDARAAAPVVSKHEPSVAPVKDESVETSLTPVHVDTHTETVESPLASATSAPDVVVVDSAASARQLVERLRTRHRGTVFACDTEVSGLNIKTDTPVGHGNLICFSLYCGEDVSEGPSRRRVWVDVTGEEKGGILAAFKEFFEDGSIKKVWHNYSFDRHIFENVGFEPRGFLGDTMHMARLLNSSRKPPNGYSLESLSADASIMLADHLREMGGDKKRSMKERFGQRKMKKDGTPGVSVTIPDMLVLQQGEDTRAEWIDYSTLDAKCTWYLYRSLESRLKEVTGVSCYGYPHVKTMMDYYEEFWRPFGEILVDMEQAGFHVDRDHLREIEQKAKAEGEQLSALVRDWAASRCPDARFMNVNSEQQIRQLLFGGFPNKNNSKSKSDKDKLYLPFERVFKIPNTDGFVEPGREGKAPRKFRNITLHNILAPLWDENAPSGATANASGVHGVVSDNSPSSNGASTTGASGAGTSLGGGVAGSDGARGGESNGTVAGAVGVEAAGVFGSALATPLMAGIGDLDDFDDGAVFRADSEGDDEAESDAGTASKKRGGAKAAKDKSEKDEDTVEAKAGGDKDGDRRVGIGPGKLPADELPSTTAGWPGCSGVVLRALAGNVDAGDVRKLGPAYQAFGGGDAGVAACRALAALWRMNSIDALLSNFILPLQGSAISGLQGRIHCSLNLNTETGRLSARRPNLQNQPALEKDLYKIRRAFSAEEGKMLIVADYGQLELRILAHMTGCESMTQAFLEGGDFHSRTAMGMYPHVREAVERGDVLLEWDEKDGPPPKPLLKNVFASERRKAKTLNFSIAYGKTAQGLAKDWKVSTEEAKATVEAWYSDRPKVKEWQESQRQFLAKHRYICTLLGRRRTLPKKAAASSGKSSSYRKSAEESREERQAINTPIQVSIRSIVVSLIQVSVVVSIVEILLGF
eukprot:jgi/Mesvir1/27305/Mv07135-RA.2